MAMKCKKLTKQEVSNQLFKGKVPIKDLSKEDKRNVTAIWKGWNKMVKKRCGR